MTAYGLPAPYRRAFLRILVSTRDYYRSSFGAGVLGNVELVARLERGAGARLWTNGADRLYLTFGEERHLQPPTRGGPRYVHGLPHELAHMVLYRSLSDLASLPAGWGEAWAVFVSSQLAVPHLARRSGPTLWPEPYDYLSAEGPASLDRRLARTADPISEGIRLLRKLWSHWGTRGFYTRLRPVLAEYRSASDYEQTLRGWAAELDGGAPRRASKRSRTRSAQRRA